MPHRDFIITTTDTRYVGPMGPQGPPGVDNSEKVKELEDKIKFLEKKLNDFIENPDKVRNQLKVDPYGEENWE